MNYPVYSIETVVSKAPEIIIISSMESKKNYLHLIKMWQNWKSIPAVKKESDLCRGLKFGRPPLSEDYRRFGGNSENDPPRSDGKTEKLTQQKN